MRIEKKGLEQGNVKGKRQVKILRNIRRRLKCRENDLEKSSRTSCHDS